MGRTRYPVSCSAFAGGDQGEGSLPRVLFIKVSVGAMKKTAQATVAGSRGWCVPARTVQEVSRVVAFELRPE